MIESCLSYKKPSALIRIAKEHDICILGSVEVQFSLRSQIFCSLQSVHLGFRAVHLCPFFAGMVGRHYRDQPYFLSRTPPCGSPPHGAAVDNEVTSGWPDLRNDNTEQVFFSTEDKDKPEHSQHGIIRRFHCFV